MYLDFTGQCAPCPVNYYSSSKFNTECRSCHFPRITLQEGSSDIDHCICPFNTLDSVDSCSPCPHLAECGYGNLTGIVPGFMLNNASLKLDECSFGTVVNPINVDHHTHLVNPVNTVLLMLFLLGFIVLEKNSC
ncbi:hypothetical protein GEMRC1_008906 [Eukaryota sp. GEM-RC1]